MNEAFRKRFSPEIFSQILPSNLQGIVSVNLLAFSFNKRAEKIERLIVHNDSRTSTPLHPPRGGIFRLRHLSPLRGFISHTNFPQYIRAAASAKRGCKGAAAPLKKKERIF
jgi:hypothetical protein